MAFLPLLRNRELFDLLDTTSKFLNELPLVEKDLVHKFSNRYAYRKSSHTDEGFEVVVHLPGVGKDNISVELLTEDRQVAVTWPEDQEVVFNLPDNVDVSDEGYKASYVDGVLKLVFSKKNPTASRRNLTIH